MCKIYKVLVINPGSGSTKVAFYENDKSVFEKSVKHPSNEITSFKKVIDQREYRKKCIDKLLKENNINLDNLDIVVGRGGPLKPMIGGIYIVDDKMEADLKYNYAAEHASLLGGLLAKDYAVEYGVKAYIADPVSVDEMNELARFSGHPEIHRVSLAHTLNIKAVARANEKKVGKSYLESNLIVAHLGSGISITAHENGKMIDVSNANSGGPFSPERAGELPVQEMLMWISEKKISPLDAIKIFTKKSGLFAYLGTIHAHEVEKMIDDGNQDAEKIYKAMGYQISKSISSMAAVLKGNVDAVIITGGLANSDRLISYIKERISFLGDVIIHPGEDEMGALSDSGLRILKGIETINN